MDILQKVRDLEARIASRVDRSVVDFVQSGAREPLEVVHAIVEATLLEIQASGRGRRVFPFTAVKALVLAPSSGARARFEAVLADGPPLGDRIIARLRSAGCDVPSLVVTIDYAARAHKSWTSPEFHVEFSRERGGGLLPPATDSGPVRLDLAVLHGVAEKRTYAFVSGRIYLGRCPEVRDSSHRLIRTNHVAFVEGAGNANQSVSRRHAHISYEPQAFRVHDDGSEHGTGIVRGGRTVPVPRGARGVRLRSGDEIVLGEARLRIKFDFGQTVRARGS